MVDEPLAAHGDADARGLKVPLKMLDDLVDFVVGDAFVDEADGASAAASAR